MNMIRPKRPASRTIRSIAALANAGLVSGKTEALETVAARYTVAIPPTLALLIADGGPHNPDGPNDPDGPIARQFVPDVRELDTIPEELADPIGDGVHSPVTGIVHRYPDRVLLQPTLSCAVYCRFCFRREAVGQGGGVLTAEQLDAAISYIAAHDEIWEVILSGGDPLILSGRRLGEIYDRLSDIPHVKTLRIHTRVPVAAPERITGGLIAALRPADNGALPVWISIHCNHARELSPDACRAIAGLRRAGFSLIAQTVLLKGVNDNVETLTALMRALVENGVQPYYLHHADLAPGTAHFRTTLAEGRALVRALRGRISGLCQPTYVVDIPGGYGKSPVGPDYLADDGTITDYQGARHDYPEKQGL